MDRTVLEVKVQRIYKINNNGFLKAFVDISVNNALLIKSVRILNGKNGLFVSMPQEKAKDQKWYDSVVALDKETKMAVGRVVLEAYEQIAEQQQ